MEKYLDSSIKEIISEFPAVADALDEHGIGCTTCGLGTCRFKDIVEIHDLDPEAERALLGEMARVIYPGREVAIPVIERKSKPAAGAVSYSPPLKKLVEEHRLIKRWLAVIPAFAASLDVDSEAGRERIRRGIGFIRSYADGFHHAKEEAILFKCFDEGLDIIKTMCADHESARALVREMLAALERRDGGAIARNLEAYRELLTEHIRKEDEILYRWMDRNLSMSQVGELFASFNAKDAEFGDTPQGFVDFISELENLFNLQEAVK